MTTVVSITDFRKDIFKYADKVSGGGEDVEVEKNGKKIFRVIKISEDARAKARDLLRITPKLAGLWKDVDASEFEDNKHFFRGKKEKKYMKGLG